VILFPLPEVWELRVDLHTLFQDLGLTTVPSAAQTTNLIVDRP